MAASGGVATGATLAAFVAVQNAWGFGRDPILLAGHLSLLYAVAYAAGLGVAALVALCVGRRPTPRTFFALLLGFAVFLNAILRWSPAIQLASVVPSLNLIGTVDLIVSALVAIAVYVAVAGSGRRIRLSCAALALLALAGVEALHSWHERPLRRDLGSVVPALVEGDRDAPEISREPFENARLVVLGFDGLTWENLLPLLERGDVPHFRAFLDGSAYGYLETLPFAVSPVVWETINSGVSPDRHGIAYHLHFDFAGLERRVARLPDFPLGNTWMGLRRLLVATHRLAPWTAVKSSGLDARAARIWEIASKRDVTVGVYDWYNVGPAVPVRGFLGSRSPFSPASHPPDLESGFAALPKPQDINPRTRGPGDPGVSEREQALWSRFVALALQYRPELLMYYTHYPDGVNHLNWKYELVGPALFFSGWSHPDFRPGPMVTAAHRWLDHVLGDVMSRVSEDTVVVVLSDHGFDFRGYEHDNAPPGVIMLRGPGIEPGLIEGADVYGVAPTLLHLLGIPAARDMPGSVFSAVEGRRLERVASFGRSIPAKGGGAAVDDEEMARQKAYLKSLGYVVD